MKRNYLPDPSTRFHFQIGQLYIFLVYIYQDQMKSVVLARYITCQKILNRSRSDTLIF